MKLLKLKLHWQILIAMVVAVILGYFVPSSARYLSWMGDLFLRGLKMVIIPLIFSSIVSGVTSIESGRSLGRIGLKTITYYIVTSLLAILTGLFLVNIIKPGVGVHLGFTETVTEVQGLQVNSLTFSCGSSLKISWIPWHAGKSFLLSFLPFFSVFSLPGCRTITGLK